MKKKTKYMKNNCEKFKKEIFNCMKNVFQNKYYYYIEVKKIVAVYKVEWIKTVKSSAMD